MAAFRRLTISLGVPAGASRPNQVCISKPLTPDSCTVGVDGNKGERARVETASARSFLVPIWGIAVGRLENIMSI